MPADLKVAFAWAMFLEEMAVIETTDAHALQILEQARQSAHEARVTMEQLLAHGQGDWQGRCGGGG